MRIFFKVALVLTFLGLIWTESFGSRIKDLVNVEGNRDNQLVGYGLVFGLDGKGDAADVTKQSVANSLKRFGITIDSKKLKSSNVAAVMVTANIPPFSKSGARIDVMVSSIESAKSLQGGVLLQTPLLGADGVVYAVAQGPIAIGGFLGGEGGSGGATVQQNHLTVGRIAAGAIVEREINADLVEASSINMSLINPDFTTAVKLADAINAHYPATAKAVDSTTINVKIPQNFFKQEVNFIASIGSIEVMPDVRARVIINERTGTIVATSRVRISTVAISQGSLTITISQTLSVSQPNPFTGNTIINQNAPTSGTDATNNAAITANNNSEVKTVVVPSTETNVHEDKGSFVVIPEYPTIERLTSALNALGVSNREMMSIFQSLRSAGALQAELIMD
ncbi:MAG: flagellar biosynthesis protein FlgA [Verrucomicrobia bacterium GWF2_51_19]|nr:MAG: flagellar biosynthesis protein FlgA [Verrucomicrobia bacterium GWF2_51_19]HCJ12282.1 flagellar biosynthesis protein FlgA [Opitutae bacterium]